MHFKKLFKRIAVIIPAAATVTFFWSGCNNPEDVTDIPPAKAEFSYINMVELNIGAENADSVNSWYNTKYIPLLLQYPGLKEIYRYKNRDPDAATDYFSFFMFPSQAAIDSLGASTSYKQGITDLLAKWPNEELKFPVSGNYEKIKDSIKTDYKGDLKAITLEAFDLVVSTEAAYNIWYNDTHLPLIMTYPGVKKVVRYQRAAAATTDINRCSLPKYITIFYYGTKEEQDNQETSDEWAAVLDDVNKQTIDDEPTVYDIKYDLLNSFLK